MPSFLIGKNTIPGIKEFKCKFEWRKAECSKCSGLFCALGCYCQVDYNYERVLCDCPCKSGTHAFVCVCVCHGHIQQERQHGTRIENLPVRTQKHREHQLLKGVNVMVHVKKKMFNNIIKTYII